MSIKGVVIENESPGNRNRYSVQKAAGAAGAVDAPARVEDSDDGRQAPPVRVEDSAPGALSNAGLDHAAIVQEGIAAALRKTDILW